MKTADLIPLILLELNECDKYGFELTKNIETKSNGKIIIKQPTLYTLLKKLEKSKFIASYWQDSEIGGKRHYYRLTENGKLQVSTLPSYDFLLNTACADETVTDVEELTQNKTEESPKAQPFMEELLKAMPTPSETILPSKEVFAESNIDNSTELEINVSNTEILKNDSVVLDENFANSSNVTKFTEKVIAPGSQASNNIKTTNEKSHDIFDMKLSIPKTEISIKFVDYTNLKNNDKYKYGKKISKKLLLQSLSTSLSLIAMLLICSIITIFTGRSGLYYFFFIVAVLITLFYPILVATNLEKIRLKYQDINYQPKTKIKAFIGLIAILFVLIVSIIVNICVGNFTIGLMLSVKNFENFYAPILFSSVYFLDLLYNHLFFRKMK